MPATKQIKAGLVLISGLLLLLLSACANQTPPPTKTYDHSFKGGPHAGTPLPRAQTYHDHTHGYVTPPVQPVVSTPKSYEAYAYKRSGRYSVPVYSGSLRNNIKRILTRFGWKRLVWYPNYDFRWVGSVTMHGASVQDIIGQLLVDYPLQAVFYRGNRVVVIKTRIAQ